MSGEGIIAPQNASADAWSRGRAAERADLLAYLTRRIRACETVMASDFDEHGLGADRKRQLSVISGEIEAGLHLGLGFVPEGAAGGRPCGSDDPEGLGQMEQI